MNRFINLTNLELKVFTEQNASDYCQINNINQSHILRLDLGYNQLTDISGIKLFKNLQILSLEKNSLTDISILKDLNNIKILYLGYNKIKDISVIQYLDNLEELGLEELELNSAQINYFNYCKKLKKLYCRNGFKDMSVLDELNKNIEIIN